MQLLKDRIQSEGRIIGDHVLKVDAFLNHQLDIGLLNQMGKAFYQAFSTCGVTKILTIEASGIAIASIAAQYFNVPVVFAKKTESINLNGDMLTTQVYSFTKEKTYDIMVAKKFITPQDVVLILDDFLAEGSAARGLIHVVEKAGANLAGVGIAIEKGFQKGGRDLRDKGVNLVSLAIIDSMSEPDRITFREIS